jgi:hypothetical protein
MALSAEEYVARLRNASQFSGATFGRLQQIKDCERAHQIQVTRYKGYVALSDAFKCFSLETVECLNNNLNGSKAKPPVDSYLLFVTRITNGFQILCGS